MSDNWLLQVLEDRIKQLQQENEWLKKEKGTWYEMWEQERNSSKGQKQHLMQENERLRQENENIKKQVKDERYILSLADAGKERHEECPGCRIKYNKKWNECVKLKDEIEKLKHENEFFKEQRQSTININQSLQKVIEQQEKQIAEREEALRKCSPWQFNGSYECETCGQIEIEEILCEFCGRDQETGHTAKCEYVRLCGGNENEAK